MKFVIILYEHRPFQSKNLNHCLCVPAFSQIVIHMLRLLQSLNAGRLTFIVRIKSPDAHVPPQKMDKELHYADPYQYHL